MRSGLHLLAGLLGLGLAGCSQVGYVVQQGIAQFGVIARSVPLEDALQDSTLTETQRRKLALIASARDFARDELQLSVGRSFTLFHNTQGKPLAYNVSASRRDRLEPRRWWFPVIGWIDYIGYFERADAQRAAEELRAEGLDTWVRAVDAFSTLGWFPDPVHSPLLERDDASLVDVVVHELAHNTVYAAGQSDFNESLATWIGRYGARRYYERLPDGADTIAQMAQRHADEAAINDWLAQTYSRLAQHYASDATSEAKLAGREALYDAARQRFREEVLPRLSEPERYSRWGELPTNNALLLQNRRYNFDLALFDRVYQARGADFAAFMAELRAAAATADPWAHLRGIAPPP